jgi:C4-dicarboxylate transporter
MVRDDEPLKAAIHGLVLGVVLIPLLYNLHIKKWSNVAIYTGVIGLEMAHVFTHIKEAK